MALYMFLPKHAAIIEVSHVCCMLTLHCTHWSLNLSWYQCFIARMVRHSMAVYQRIHALLGNISTFLLLFACFAAQWVCLLSRG